MIRINFKGTGDLIGSGWIWFLSRHERFTNLILPKLPTLKFVGEKIVRVVRSVFQFIIVGFISFYPTHSISGSKLMTLEELTKLMSG